jgi:uncharacterized protein
MVHRLVWTILLVASAAAADPAKVTTGPCAGRTWQSCTGLAAKYEVGDGVERDKSRAAVTSRAACDAKVAEACTGLGMLGADAGLDGAGIRKALRTGCNLGDVVGCSALAGLLVDSDRKPERAEGLLMLEKLCLATPHDRNARNRQLHVTACFERAEHASDPRERVTYYSRACTAGHQRGCEQLAQIYFRDENPDSGPVASRRALEKLCKGGTIAACSLASERAKRESAHL